MSAPNVVTKSLSLLERMLIPFLNIFGKKNQFKIVITSPDYVKFRVLWGLISYEKGEKREFVISGTEAYTKAIVSSLISRNLNVEKLLVK